MTMVCATDGVELVESKRKGFIHVGEIPKGVDEEHEVVPVVKDEWLAGVVKKGDVDMLAVALMRHHMDHHADPACPWVTQLDAALRSRVG